MAHISDEVLGEYDVVAEPEDARQPVIKDFAPSVDETLTDQQVDEAPPADSSSIDNKSPVKKTAMSMIDGHQVQNPPVEILCPRVNCAEKIVRI